MSEVVKIQIQVPTPQKITVGVPAPQKIVVSTPAPQQITVNAPGPQKIQVNVPAPQRINVQATIGPIGPKGDKGDKGDPGDGLFFTHDQSIPSAVWNINHGLGYNPNVAVVDSSGRLVEGDKQYIDSNNIQVTFSAAFAGKAYCS